MNGIEIKIDELGRLVIPIKYRRKLGIIAKDKLLISLRESSLVITPILRKCALCGEKLTGDEKIQLCENCISKVNKMENV